MRGLGFFYIAVAFSTRSYDSVGIQVLTATGA
jgi:hypothetical protein